MSRGGARRIRDWGLRAVIALVVAGCVGRYWSPTPDQDLKANLEAQGGTVEIRGTLAAPTLLGWALPGKPAELRAWGVEDQGHSLLLHSYRGSGDAVTTARVERQSASRVEVEITITDPFLPFARDAAGYFFFVRVDLATPIDTANPPEVWDVGGGRNTRVSLRIEALTGGPGRTGASGASSPATVALGCGDGATPSQGTPGAASPGCTHGPTMPPGAISAESALAAARSAVPGGANATIVWAAIASTPFAFGPERPLTWEVRLTGAVGVAACLPKDREVPPNPSEAPCLDVDGGVVVVLDAFTGTLLGFTH